MATRLDAAVIRVGCLEWRLAHGRFWIGAETLDFGKGERPVGSERKEIVAAALHDGLGDRRPCAHRVNGDKSAAPVEPFERQWNGGDVRSLSRMVSTQRVKQPANKPGSTALTTSSSVS